MEHCHVQSSTVKMLWVWGPGNADYVRVLPRASYPQGDGHACGELNHLRRKSHATDRWFNSKLSVRINLHLEPRVCRKLTTLHDFLFAYNLQLAVLQQPLLLPTSIPDRHFNDRLSPLLEQCMLDIKKSRKYSKVDSRKKISCVFLPTLSIFWCIST